MDAVVVDFAAAPFRPTITFKSIKFSDGQQINLQDDEVVVFVGPNNAGKSAALRELEQWIRRSNPQTVTQNTDIKRNGNSEDLRLYLENNSLKIRHEDGHYSYAGIGYSIHETHLSYFDQMHDRHPVAPFFTARLATETRITASNPAGAIALHQEAPSHPIHLLLMDNVLAQNISNYFFKAFGKDLIVFRAGGASFPLMVGKRPDKMPGEDDLSKTYVDRLLDSAKPLQDQGDGMRSFATVILNVLASDNQSIQFLDEPEAFLHPPQARLLGEYIARERRSKSQLFIATHSTDILDGLMAGGTDKIRIVRIQRNGNVNNIKELSKEKTKKIFSDTLTRYSGVFRGIFYRHVIISESDSDCLFYSSILNTNSVSGEQNPDILFIHAAGKHRMVSLAETLRALDVPVSVIADLDLLSEKETFKNLLETLGGSWDAVSAQWTAIKTSVEEHRPPLTAEQVKGQISKQIADVGGNDPFPKQAEREIKRIFKSVSPWNSIKQAGRRGFNLGGTTKHFDNLAQTCANYGLWLVPEGELEGFCRGIEAGHGPAFVEKVLEERNLETDEELAEARQFVQKIWARAKGEND